ncbi:MAG: ATP-binding cassette domain-containing protein [Betaproteobacteria bacterium]|nr:ATP-binding cassette domain-containing protein [Betaproteobacteria bacterium]
MSGGALSLVGVRIALAGRALVDGLDLVVGAGECVTLMGPSGCGKSTLLAFVAGSIGPPFAAAGRVLVGGDDATAWPPERRRIGILFQDDLLFPHLSVGGNLAFALHERVRGATSGVPASTPRSPRRISPGSPTAIRRRCRAASARVALMRTLLAEPRALLLDEPFNKLDAQLRDDVRRFVFDHALERAIPILLVTHDEADARAAAGRVLRFGDEGRLRDGPRGRGGGGGGGGPAAGGGGGRGVPARGGPLADAATPLARAEPGAQRAHRGTRRRQHGSARHARDGTAARARLNCESAMTSACIVTARATASAASRSCASPSPRSSAAMAPSTITGTISTSFGNSAGIDASVGANVATSATRRTPARASATASSIIASLGFSTGLSGQRLATASMHGPNAEHVNRMAAAPVPNT